MAPAISPSDIQSRWKIQAARQQEKHRKPFKLLIAIYTNQNGSCISPGGKTSSPKTLQFSGMHLGLRTTHNQVHAGKTYKPRLEQPSGASLTLHSTSHHFHLAYRMPENAVCIPSRKWRGTSSPNIHSNMTIHVNTMTVI